LRFGKRDGVVAAKRRLCGGLGDIGFDSGLILTAIFSTAARKKLCAAFTSGD
jgi:hypothetical protein